MAALTWRSSSVDEVDLLLAGGVSEEVLAADQTQVEDTEMVDGTVESTEVAADETEEGVTGMDVDSDLKNGLEDSTPSLSNAHESAPEVYIETDATQEQVDVGTLTRFAPALQVLHHGLTRVHSDFDL